MSLLLIASLACRNKESFDSAAQDSVPLVEEEIDADADGYLEDVDCDDSDASVHPDAEEVCNGIDDNCDEQIDEGVTGTFYTDADGDGWGDEDSPVEDCDGTGETTWQAGDCNDDDATVSPNATEVCNGVDDDCDGDTDGGAVDMTVWFGDGDGDGYGAGEGTESCDSPDGTVSDDSDCDDSDGAVNPGATEVCNDLDDDCDDAIDADDVSVADAETWYLDLDGDGYGYASISVVDCDQPDEFVSDDTDCDDTDEDVNPGATEICNDLDDDCDGDLDDDDGDLDASTASSWYDDTDGDGYGDAAALTLSCDQPSGTVTNDTDCDDTDADISPDGTEICDGVDNDCDGSLDAGTEGSDIVCSALSCQDVYDNVSGATDGLYWIDPDDDGDTTDAWEAWCDMTNDGGGWTKIYSSLYPTFWSSSNYTAVGDSEDDDYSDIAELSDFASSGGTYTLRLEVGDSGVWDSATRAHYTVWTQDHHPFTATSDGTDYTWIAGDESTTCSGFAGLHQYGSGTYYMSSDVDSTDSTGCWWMQIVPLQQYSSSTSYPGYLEGYEGHNVHTWHVLWVQ